MQAMRCTLFRSLVRLQTQQCILMHYSTAATLARRRAVSVLSTTVQQPQEARYPVSQTRTYAKKVKKDKDGKGKKSSKPKVELSSEELNSAIDFDKFQQHMQDLLDALKQDFVTQLSLRSSIGSLDNLVVDTADGKFPLIQLGQVAQKNPQLVVINMATAPQYISEVKDAILGSGMNLNPQQDGTTLFVPVPKVTREHREQLAKGAKTLCDKTKERLRDTQNKFVRDLKKKKGLLSEDLLHNVQETLQTYFSSYCSEAEKMMVAKQKELTGNK